MTGDVNGPEHVHKKNQTPINSVIISTLERQYKKTMAGDYERRESSFSENVLCLLAT
jgi:hypothetical protein